MSQNRRLNSLKYVIQSDLQSETAAVQEALWSIISYLHAVECNKFWFCDKELIWFFRTLWHQIWPEDVICKMIFHFLMLEWLKSDQYAADSETVCTPVAWARVLTSKIRNASLIFRKSKGQRSLQKPEHHQNPSVPWPIINIHWVLLFKNKLTDKHWLSHNLLGGGNNHNTAALICVR